MNNLMPFESDYLKTKYTILKNTFGFETFRNNQENIIDQIL